jgi:hypothetical protein
MIFGFFLMTAEGAERIPNLYGLGVSMVKTGYGVGSVRHGRDRHIPLG